MAASGMFGLNGDDGMFGLKQYLANLFTPAQVPADMYSTGIYGGQNNPLGPVAKAVGNVASMAQDMPVSMGHSAFSGLTSVGEAYDGKISPDQMIPRAMDAAGLAMTGGLGSPASANELRMGIKAYHGSPHDFDQFSMDKIGTGEGAQAYGHGLYFADNEGVANGYRKALSGPDQQRWIEAQGQPLDLDSLRQTDPQAYKGALEYHVRQSYQPPEGATDRIRQGLLNTVKNYEGGHIPMDTGYSDAKDALHFIDNYQPAVIPDKRAGHMYEVNINADPNHMLDWDKPLSEQSDTLNTLVGARLEKFLDAAGPQIQRPYDRFISGEMTGEEAYRLMHPQSGVDSPIDFNKSLPAQASQQLRDAGIPGIKYLDAGSRPDMARVKELRDAAAKYTADGKPPEYAAEALKLANDIENSGSRNYVVFDQNLVNVVRKYGIAGAVSAGLITAQQAQQMSQGQNQQNLNWITRGGT